MLLIVRNSRAIRMLGAKNKPINAFRPSMLLLLKSALYGYCLLMLCLIWLPKSGGEPPGGPGRDFPVLRDLEDLGLRPVGTEFRRQLIRRNPLTLLRRQPAAQIAGKDEHIAAVEERLPPFIRLFKALVGLLVAEIGA